MDYLASSAVPDAPKITSWSIRYQLSTTAACLAARDRGALARSGFVAGTFDRRINPPARSCRWSVCRTSIRTIADRDWRTTDAGSCAQGASAPSTKGTPAIPVAAGVAGYSGYEIEERRVGKECRSRWS